MPVPVLSEQEALGIVDVPDIVREDALTEEDLRNGLDLVEIASFYGDVLGRGRYRAPLAVPTDASGRGTCGTKHGYARAALALD